MKNRILLLQFSYVGSSWTATFEPHQPSISDASMSGCGTEGWRRYVPEWDLVDGAMFVDFRDNPAAFSVSSLPLHNHTVPRGMVRRFRLGGEEPLDAIDWTDLDRFGCLSLDYVHPFDLAEMWRRKGVLVLPLTEFFEREGMHTVKDKAA